VQEKIMRTLLTRGANERPLGTALHV
jgi:hypothetical protein